MPPGSPVNGDSPLSQRFRLSGARLVMVTVVPVLVVTVTGAAGTGGGAGSAAGTGGVSVAGGAVSTVLAFFSNTCRPGPASVKPLSVRSPMVPDRAATHCGHSSAALTSLPHALLLTATVTNCPSGILSAKAILPEPAGLAFGKVENFKVTSSLASMAMA